MTFRLNRLSKGFFSIKWSVFPLILRKNLLSFIISGSEVGVNIILGGYHGTRRLRHWGKI